jgi:alkylation response protein AidB-like acyl-CoA dehydrogenase
MNFDDTPEEAAFRAEARAWISAHAPARTDDVIADARAWQRQKYDGGWACLQWPKEYGGRGATPIERVIWGQEEGVLADLSNLFVIGQGMCGPTLMAYASEAQKQRYLPAIASGAEIWCQLFSEPSGGSDLAGLRTRAEPAGDGSGDWIVNGQKIWTSGAHISDYGILVTRTDPTLPKHKGLTMFFLDMRSPGVEARPIKQANGEAFFNEVYFTDVRIPDAQRLGPVNGGWESALTTLMNERLTISAGGGPSIFSQLFELCCAVETTNGLAIDDPAVRSKLATWAVRTNGLKYTSYRTLSAISRGDRPGPESSIGKLVSAPMGQEMAMFALDLLAQAGPLIDRDGPFGKRFQAMLLRSPATRVEGGTDEIMRNIIGERVLGLPADIRADKGIPFNEIPTSGRR